MVVPLVGLDNFPSLHLWQPAPYTPATAALRELKIEELATKQVEAKEEPMEPEPEPQRVGPVKGVKSQPGAGADQRREDFRRLANKRTCEAIDAIINIASLANPKNYRAFTKDWTQILRTLRETVDKLEVRVSSLEDITPMFELAADDE
jgi:hypothetical protein